jgi:hypothetical protein
MYKKLVICVTLLPSRKVGRYIGRYFNKTLICFRTKRMMSHYILIAGIVVIRFDEHPFILANKEDQKPFPSN